MTGLISRPRTRPAPLMSLWTWWFRSCSNAGSTGSSIAVTRSETMYGKKRVSAHEADDITDSMLIADGGYTARYEGKITQGEGVPK